MRAWRALAPPLVFLAACAVPAEGPFSADGDTAGVDAGGGPPPPSAEYDDSALGGDAAPACFDGLDNDANGVADCEDLSCRSNLVSCCVGSADAACCRPGAPIEIPIGDCEGPLDGCVTATEYAIFGERSPEVIGLTGEAAALVPNGSDGRDGGAVRLEALDPRRGAITIAASVAADLEEASEEIGSVGFGLLDATQDPADLLRVEPDVGVVVSRNRSVAMLLIAGEVVAEHPLPDSEMHLYELRVTPAGQVELTVDGGEARLGGETRAEGSLRLAVWGRTPSGVTSPARMESLRLVQDECDMPGALTPGPVVVPAPTDPDPSWTVEALELARPHVLRFDDGSGPKTWMALRADGRIHIAEPGQGGFVDAFGPVLEPPAEGWAEEGVDHPRLRWIDGRLELWLTGYGTLGHGTVAVARWDEAAERFVDPTPIAELTTDGVTSYEAAAPFDARGMRLAVVRVRTDEDDALALWEVPVDGPARQLSVLRQTRPSQIDAFDRDALDSPAIVHAGGVFRLYFSGRRGNRWSLGLLVSDDALNWRAPLEGPVAGPTGTGFDAIGRRDPAPLVEGDALSLYFAGFDGVRTRIGRLDGDLPR